jgi:hypothetical protein
MVALDIPPGAQIAAIRSLLLQGQHDGWWEYEEGCIVPAWQTAGQVRPEPGRAVSVQHSRTRPNRR